MDIVCFSHLRWNFVFQRPQHLLTRLSSSYRVFYIEEPICGDRYNRYDMSVSNNNVYVITPFINCDVNSPETVPLLKNLLAAIWDDFHIRDFMFWYYTPMALPYTRHMSPVITVYDCMDELSAFKFAPTEISRFEDELFDKADVVFTGGQSLYEAKKDRHHNIHAFPSSIDKVHFGKARRHIAEPPDQENIPYPRIGFFGVVDERFDIDLVKEVAMAKPEWQIVLIGPVVKIDEQTLPRLPNIHYLGQKNYHELPAYISGWQIAMLPFALNESTKFISPTKTPEYLAAGKPVISTAIRDVVKPYGVNGHVHIIANAKEFIEKADMELAKEERVEWMESVDIFLNDLSWEKTCNGMRALIHESLSEKHENKKEASYV